ncbi:hypothetical protein BCR42DRAFT_446639 [Absidia repens]|uniref:Uncharacterized protein n=1 Tax=Absidia repens TaxID=90262 RepID=A0A1X2IZG8_9FUNG|nr:hypothetical protein BCR42DRAFT_446639 [Absidia repens]
MNMVNIDHSNVKQENIDWFGTIRKYTESLLVTTLDYWNGLKDIILQLWQYWEFRILVFIFAGLSCIPFAIFLLFCTCLTCLVMFISASVWLVFSTIATFVLFPFLIGSMGVAVGLVLVYQVCVITKISLASIFSASANDENDDDLVICDDNKK